MKRKLIATLLAVTMLLGAVGCGKQEAGDSTSSTNQTNQEESSQSDKAAGDEQQKEAGSEYRSIRVGTNEEISSLSPFAYFTTRGAADRNVYETLAIITEFGGELEGIIAKEWTVDDSGLEMDVEIYDYVHDTEGNHITAEDVVFCYEQMISQGYVTKVESVKATGDYTLHFVFTSSALGTVNDVLYDVPIVSKKAYEASTDGMAMDPVGTTCYVVTDYVIGSHVTLQKTDDYWQKDELKYSLAEGTVDEITYVTIKEVSQMNIALETGQIDAINKISDSQVTYFDPEGEYTYPDYELFSVPLTQVYCGFFSGDSSSVVSDDVNLRKAIAHAIDREALVVGLLDGRGYVTEALGLPLHKDYPAVPEDGYFTYDVDVAKEYLAASNYNGESVRILTATVGILPKYGQIIASCLQAIGINAEVCAYEAALYQTYFRTPTEFDLALTYTGSSPYCSNIWANFLCSTNNDGKTTTHGVADPKLDELVNAANSIQLHSEETVNAAQDYINEMCYAMGFFGGNQYYVADKELHIEELKYYKGYHAAWWTCVFAE